MQALPGGGGVWVALGDSALGPWDIANARYVAPETVYAGQLFQDRLGRWRLGGFELDDQGGFVGGIMTPRLWKEVELLSRPLG